MNDRLRTFERASGIEIYGLGTDRIKWEAALEKYAELVVRECLNKIENDPRFQILVEVDRLLSGSRIWAGFEYEYHPIHPVKYRPVRDKVNQALADIRKEYGLEE